MLSQIVDLTTNRTIPQILPTELHIDSEVDCFGQVFRVWSGSKHLGNFWLSPLTEQWLAHPFTLTITLTVTSETEAVHAIASAWRVWS